jgi:hypothetical protein
MNGPSIEIGVDVGVDGKNHPIGTATGANQM